MSLRLRRWSSTIGGSEEVQHLDDRWGSFKYLEVYLTEALYWKIHIHHFVRRTNQRIYHLRWLARFKISQKVLRTSSTGAVESLITGSIIPGLVWKHNGPRSEIVVQSGKVCTESHQDFSPWHQKHLHSEMQDQAKRIIKDFHHPGHLLSLLPSGKRYRILRDWGGVFILRELNEDTGWVCRTFKPHINTYITYWHRHYHILIYIYTYVGFIYIIDLFFILLLLVFLHCGTRN